MNKFENVIAELNESSKLLKDREKIKTEELVNLCPAGVHITGIDCIVNKEGDKCVVCVCSEQPTRFFFGGKMIHDIAEKWLEMYSGDIEQLNADLLNCGGAFVHFERTTTKNGRSFTKITV